MIIKDLLTLIKELSYQREKRKNKAVQLLEDISLEITGLANSWSNIAALANSDLESNKEEIRNVLRNQIDNYYSAKEFFINLSSDGGKMISIDSKIINIIESAVGEKARLYKIVTYLIGDTSIHMFFRYSDPEEDSYRGVIESAKNRFLKEEFGYDLAKEGCEDGLKMIIHEGAGELMKFSGQFRAAIALLKAETDFI